MSARRGQTVDQAVELKSAQFRRERAAAWRSLEDILARAEKRGVAALGQDDLLRLPSLYRTALSSLSVARAISLDRSLLAYLESLAARAYLQIYGPRASLPGLIGDFLRRGFPDAVRRLWPHIALSALALAAGAGSGYWLAFGNSDWFYTLVPTDLAGDRSPAADTEVLRAALYDPDRPGAGMLSVFASFLFTHNAKIGILAFGLGFACGLPSLLLLAGNGLTLGAFVALYAERGLGFDVLAWLAIHGTSELLAVILCGAGGLALGQALVFPGEETRLAALARQGRLAARLVLGAVLMLFAAGLLEGLGRQLILDPLARLGLGAAMLAFWLGYFLFAGRAAASDGD